MWSLSSNPVRGDRQPEGGDRLVTAQYDLNVTTFVEKLSRYWWKQMSGEVFTLVGVLIGAAASYTVTALNDRARWARQLATRWDERRLESYSRFTDAIKHLVQIAERIASGKGIFPRPQPIDRESGLEMLAQANAARGYAFESILLMGDSKTISAARALQRQAWNLESLVRPPDTGSVDEWKRAYRDYQKSRDEFYLAARKSLGVTTQFQPRSADPATWDPLDQ